MAVPTIQIDHNNALRLASAISLLLGHAMEGLTEVPPDSESAQSLSELMLFQKNLINYSLTHPNETGNEQAED